MCYIHTIHLPLASETAFSLFLLRRNDLTLVHQEDLFQNMFAQLRPAEKAQENAVSQVRLLGLP